MGVERFALLTADQRAAVTGHLVALDKSSRVFRFGAAASDRTIAQYVAALDFERDIVVGCWDDDILVGVAHLALYPKDDQPVGELGISILLESRRLHMAQQLLTRALLFARLRCVKEVYVEFLVRNRAMAGLAGKFTSLVDRSAGEARAIIDLCEHAKVAA
jgi:hypothetical protein